MKNLYRTWSDFFKIEAKTLSTEHTKMHLGVQTPIILEKSYPIQS